jgi:hypothetical protein
VTAATAAKDYPRAECDSCQAAIIWCITVNAKAMPVDYEPAGGGNIALSWRGGKILAEVLSVTRQATRVRGTLRTSHFVTCPDARTFRRRRTAA